MREKEINEKSKGLYYNVNKRKEAGTSRKQGHPEAPSAQDWKNAAKTAKETTNEGLAELAGAAERDHEVQMARADLYKLAKYAIKLHDMLKGVSEAEGLEGWVQSKITKSADMIGSVYHHMDYDEAMDEVIEPEPQEMAEGPFKGVGKMMMKKKLNKQYKKADLANFDKSGISTKGKTPDEIGDMKSDYYHDNMDKAARAKKAKDRLSKKQESLQDKLATKLEGKFKSDAHRKAVHAGKASGKKAKKSLRK